jgi:CRISPR-associated endonuclease/helicase Cas3
MDIYAHSLENTGPDKWQTLEDHLRNVADRGAGFAGAFGAAEWGRILGAYHDIGKRNPKFQQRLTGEYTGHADHKGTGARLFDELGNAFGRMAAYCIAGHHSGLPDFYGTDYGASLGRIIEKAYALPDDNPLDGLEPPGWPFMPQNGFQCSFLIRMLFSSLVDADFLDTESFMDTEKSSWRVSGPSLESLRAALDRKLAEFDGAGRINGLRAEILAHCRKQAVLDPGLFTLTVPTGGGKTLSSMAFALDHALRHDMRRVVHVIPYTSIIEQNARVFRDVFREFPGAVVEHHSNFDADSTFGVDNARESEAARRHRLACENWDAPVVVTTNVQFFESLFAAKTSRCRKLHNLAGSVIVLDEAQMLPVDFMDPCLRALEELAAHYRCSVVLCTATQPALRREDFARGLAGLDGRELAPDPVRLHEAFERTELHDLDELGLPEVADLVRERDQVLCIVNTRARASELFGMIRGEPGARHLSALMCPAHRSERLNEIRAMLSAGKPCRVVSTQLVEAGVDVSFPEVIREMAGLDSIVQAAGRCNREGEREGTAPVSVFYPAEGLPKAFAAQAGHAASVLRGPEGRDPFSPEAVKRYFGLHYWLESDHMDQKRIMESLGDEDGKGEWYFKRAEHDFRLIDNPMVPVIIPWDDTARKLLDDLRYAEHPGGILRRLQQYTVQVYDRQFKALDEAGGLEMVVDGCAALSREELYDDLFGLAVLTDSFSKSFIF